MGDPGDAKPTNEDSDQKSRTQNTNTNNIARRTQLATSSRKGVLEYLDDIPRIVESRYEYASEQASHILTHEGVPESTGGLARGSSAMRMCIANMPPTTGTHRTN